ncbi:hypothetical protein SBRY_50531 [Actinacidiphila bryophytorum]|uniref:Uncharacterized protein n=1 Tax=Actinacidiphila bryophytorum TaxID=1436133 RepID=A0A9W4MIJ0_9ACTN|nr:hypothetical protein SBRY_50531 [Actinacidiphila bryophytorum]
MTSPTGMVKTRSQPVENSPPPPDRSPWSYRPLRVVSPQDYTDPAPRTDARLWRGPLRSACDCDRYRKPEQAVPEGDRS